MMLERPMFIEKGFAIYTDEGIKIKDDAPVWAKEEYEEYIKIIEKGYIEEEGEEEEEE